jgi:hypothetical protein
MKILCKKCKSSQVVKNGNQDNIQKYKGTVASQIIFYFICHFCHIC